VILDPARCSLPGFEQILKSFNASSEEKAIASKVRFSFSRVTFVMTGPLTYRQ